MGDLNASTGALLDVTGRDETDDGLSDALLADNDDLSAGLAKRHNSDATTDNMGFQLVDFCQEMGMVIVNGLQEVGFTNGKATDM